MAKPTVMVAISGGVDSAVAALRLQQAGYPVEALHMTNWEDDDGYCTAAEDAQDARRICDHLGIHLHRVNFAEEYREAVFSDFLSELSRGRTPNPDIGCNQIIKFGVFQRYAKRLGAERFATGHYAQCEQSPDGPKLLKAADGSKDQTYFLHSVSADQLQDVTFPLGNLTKTDVRQIALEAGLPVAAKKDSTGICFIGERPFENFLREHLTADPGDIIDDEGRVVGEHRGLPYYTIGQRQGLGIGGLPFAADAPWYVAAKDLPTNRLIVVQGPDHPWLYHHGLRTDTPHWITRAPSIPGEGLPCTAKIRYRQPDQPCRVFAENTGLRVTFDQAQRAVTPGQFAVFYEGAVCLGGAVIDCALDRKNLGSIAAQG